MIGKLITALSEWLAMNQQQVAMAHSTPDRKPGTQGSVRGSVRSSADQSYLPHRGMRKRADKSIPSKRMSAPMGFDLCFMVTLETQQFLCACCYEDDDHSSLLKGGTE